jgi:hypothetical protein
VNILEALSDVNLFQPHFRGASWRAWRAFLAALFGLPMSADEIALYRRHTERRTPPTTPFTEAALVIGRRGGKSRVLALVATYLACFRDYAQYLAAGEVATVAVIAADRRQARVIFRFITGLLDGVPMLRALVAERTAETIVLSNRVTIEVHTASFRVTRGYTFGAVLCDETAFWRSEDTARPDTEIFRALRPGLGTIPGAMLLNASSPYRRTGVLYQAYAQHFGHDDSRTLVWQAPTLSMNPTLDPSVVARAFEDDPLSASAEYGAEFRNDIADFISRSVVEACIEPGVFEHPASRARRYVAFIDASGGSGSDSMTLAIAHSEEGIPTLDAVRERKPPFSPDAVVAEFSALLKSYRVTRAEADRWGGDWVGEAFRKNGITVEPSAKPKSDIYVELLPMLNATRCSLLDNPRLVGQLCGLERRTSRGGRDSINHSPGSHDDIANACAGALLLVGQRPPMRIDQRVLAQSRLPGGMRHAF